MRTKVIGNLEWQEEVSEKRFTWAEAKTYATAQGNRWRLPTIQELLTLVDPKKRHPACAVFPDCPSEWFWASPYEGLTNRTWGVNFADGFACNDVGPSGRVRLVREMRMP